MAALDGWLGLSPQGGIVNANLTSALHQYALDNWPPHPALVTAMVDGVLATHWPVSIAPRSLDGWRAAGFVDDFYNRIHIRPSPLALGNVLETQTTNLTVWNAYFVPQTLTGISGIEEGILLAAPAGVGGPPSVFAALQEQDWQISVTRDGPGRIDVLLSWLFAAAPTSTLRITGLRLVAWSFVPNWADGVLERLSWKTDVLTSGSGAEQRRALRLAPRRSFEAKALLEGRERALLDLTLAGWGARVWALPVWPDVQQLGAALALGAVSVPCSTSGRDFVAGGVAMLIGATAFDAETVEVLSVGTAALTLKRPTQRAWPAGTRLYPARSAQLAQQPTLHRLTDRLAELDFVHRLVDASDWPAAAAPTSYRGAPVFALKPDESEDLTTTWQRLLLELDNGTGSPALTDTADLGLPVQGHRWVLGARAEQAVWRSLVYGLRGRQGVVWLPTHADDLQLVATATNVASTIDVAAVGYTRFAVGRPGRRDVRLELSDGTVLHRRITGGSEISADVERLAIDTAPGVLLQPAGTSGVHVMRISYLQLVRLDQDDIELQHVTDADGVATAQVVWRTLRDELELAA